MFTFNPRPRFKATVAVREPGAEAEQSFTGIFQVLPQDETERLQGRDVPPDRIAEANREWLAKIFVGWEDDLVVDGTALPVTPGNIDLLMSAPWVRAAVVATYLRELSGFARKN